MLLFFFSLCYLLLFFNCDKDDSNVIPTVRTEPAKDINNMTATLEGYIITEGTDLITNLGFEYSITENFTEGTGTKIKSSLTESSSFSTQINGLEASTFYYFRAYVINSEGTFYGTELNFKTSEPQVEDIDGNIYSIVTIGNQTWMSENLRVTHYPNGSEIPNVISDDNWGKLEDNDIDDAYTLLYDNEYYLKYGALYTYAAAIKGTSHSSGYIQGVCPKDWHIPSEAEWQELLDYVSAEGKEVQALLSIEGWNGNGTNQYGFSLLPSGHRSFSNGSFEAFGSFGFYWSSSKMTSDTYAQMLKVYQTDAEAVILGTPKSSGLCVRCIKN